MYSDCPLNLQGPPPGDKAAGQLGSRRTPRLGPKWVNKIHQAVPDSSREWSNLYQINKRLISNTSICSYERPRTNPVDPMISGK